MGVRKRLEKIQMKISECRLRNECTKRLCDDLPCTVYRISRLKFNSQTRQIVGPQEEETSNSEDDLIALDESESDQSDQNIKKEGGMSLNEPNDSDEKEAEFLERNDENGQQIEDEDEQETESADEFCIDSSLSVYNEWSDLTDSSTNSETEGYLGEPPRKKQRYRSREVWNKKSEEDELSEEAEFDDSN